MADSSSTSSSEKNAGEGSRAPAARGAEGATWRGLVRGALFVLAIAAALDYGIGVFLRRAYFTQTSGLQYRTTMSMENAGAGLLVFGTSRANHHYVPAVLEDGIGLDVYNAGRDGSSVLYHEAVLEAVLARRAPAAVLLDLNAGDFVRSKANYDRLAVLLPYWADHPEIRPILRLRSRFEEIKLLSRIYPFNSSLLTILAGNLESNRERRPDIDGYIPLRGRWNRSLGEEERPDREEIDPVLVRHFEKFVERAAGCGARVVVVVSPAYYRRAGEPETIRIAREICRERGAPFLDFGADEFFLGRPDLFQDPYHLNHEGAELFSGRLAETIEREIPGANGGGGPEL
ncbi:MAG: hypothetical protein EHM19_06740 [Candidatus Latescibacterota bacterium]|nr:MAG: hypothetical protein EHM19_06740 [Candidatus Latescibacterota bacterium]